MGILVAVTGLLLAVFVLVDVWLTILHPDGEGPLARFIRFGVWRTSSALARRRPTVGRQLLALAGPVLVLATFTLWLSLLVLGLAMAIWPHMDSYLTSHPVGRLTFVDAVYYIAGTVAVLGYGDITPGTAPLKLFGAAVAALGFALFTALTTYVIQVINGLAVRNHFALAVHDQVRHRGGAGAIARGLADEGMHATRRRCQDWADSLRVLDDIVHRYPIAALTYRPRRPAYDLEPALHHIADAAVAALLAARAATWRGLGPSAEQLAHSLLRLQDTIAHRYLPAATADQLADPRPNEDDRRVLAQINDLLTEELGPHYRQEPPDDHLVVEVVARSRVFLDALWNWAGHGVSSQRPTWQSP